MKKLILLLFIACTIQAQDTTFVKQKKEYIKMQQENVKNIQMLEKSLEQLKKQQIELNAIIWAFDRYEAEQDSTKVKK